MPSKAIRLPSGDQAGMKSDVGLPLILATPLAAGFIGERPPVGSARVLENAILPFLPGTVACAVEASAAAAMQAPASAAFRRPPTALPDRPAWNLARQARPGKPRPSA